MGVTVVFRGAKTEEIGDTQTLVDTILLLVGTRPALVLASKYIWARGVSRDIRMVYKESLHLPLLYSTLRLHL